MEKIININYQNRNISIEENAYNSFKVYENELKTYFLKEEGGEETFADLQNRMAEIFEEKLKKGKVAIQQSDIDELVSTIGNPKELDENYESTNEPKFETPKLEEKKLYRNKDKSNRIIAGVCSGIANYFSMDPIAIRLIFVLFALFNILTLFKINLAIIGYIILWAVLPSQEMKVNISQKFFRNPKDKVIGGVCSGLAQFFKTETWIVRAIFLVPLLLGMVGNSHYNWIFHSNFEGFHFSPIHSFSNLSFTIYIVLLIITPVAKSSTDFMLLKGEPIKYNTIMNSNAMASISQEAKSGMNVVLKVIAYIFIVIFLMIFIPTAIGILVTVFFSYDIASIVLFSNYNKILALISLTGLIIIPLVSFVIWIFRLIAGYRSQNKILKVIFSAFSFISIVCTLLLASNLINEMNTYSGVKKIIPITTNDSTIYVSNTDSTHTRSIIFQLNNFGNLIEKNKTSNNIKAIRLKYEESKDSTCYMEIEQTAFGDNPINADKNCSVFNYEPSIENNRIILPTHLTISNAIPYRLQNVLITIYVPKGKKLIVSKSLKNELSHSFIASKHNFYFNIDDDKYKDDEEVFFGNNDDSNSKIVTTVNDEGVITNQSSNDEELERKKEAIEKIKQANEDLKNAQKDAEEKIKDAQRELEDAKKETERTIKEASK